jgi:hypothetical protein
LYFIMTDHRPAVWQVLGSIVWEWFQIKNTI